MQKKRIYILLVFIILMSFFSGVFNFLIWNDFSLSLGITLPAISSYTSLGAAFAYILGFIVLSFFSYRILLFLLVCFLFLSLGSVYLWPFSHSWLLISSILGVGFVIGLWNITKNIFLSFEIIATGWRDTTINGLASIAFVVSLLLGSIGGNLLFSYWGRATYIVILIILACLMVLSLFLIYPKEKKLNTELGSFFHLGKGVGKHYRIILSSCFFWVIMSAISQIFIEYSNTVLAISPFRSSFLLGAGALGIIGGNILSSVLRLPRLSFLLWSSFVWALFFLVNSFFIATFQGLLVFVFLLSFVFGIISNLIDARFLDLISQESKKDTFSSLYGFSLSISIFVGTLVIEQGSHFFGLENSLYLIALAVFGFGLLFSFSKKYSLLFK